MGINLTGVLPTLGAGRGITAAETSPTRTAGADSPAATTGAGESFGTVLARALDDLNATQQVADTGAARLAAGAPVDLHQVMIGMEQATLSFDLALQVRNKLIEAYQEISRMPI